MGLANGARMSAPDSASLSGADLDDVCAVCGQLLGGETVALCWQPTRRPWWPWLLVVVGLYLVVVFGTRAWDAHWFLPSPQEQAVCRRADRTGFSTAYGCDIVQRNTAQFGHALVAVVIGVVGLLLGVGRLAWPKPPGLADPNRAWEAAIERGNVRNRETVGSILLRALAETLLLPCFGVFLALVGCALGAALAHGAPLSFDLVNVAVDRTLDAATAVMTVVTLPLPVP